MTDAQMLKKFASAICESLPAIVELYSQNCDMLVKQASDIEGLRKEASDAKAAVIKLDSQKLYKAASAVNKLFGGSMSAEQLYSVYEKNPNAMVDSLFKVASHQVGATVSGNLGTVRSIKKETPKVTNRRMDAGELWDSL